MELLVQACTPNPKPWTLELCSRCRVNHFFTPHKRPKEGRFRCSILAVPNTRPSEATMMQTGWFASGFVTSQFIKSPKCQQNGITTNWGSIYLVDRSTRTLNVVRQTNYARGPIDSSQNWTKMHDHDRWNNVLLGVILHIETAVCGHEIVARTSDPTFPRGSCAQVSQLQGSPIYEETEVVES